MNNQNSTIIKISGVDFEIKFPDVGGLHEIENQKLLLTNGNYGDLARSAHNKALRLLDMVDAFVTIKILVPKLNMELTDFYKLEQMQALEYVKVYKLQIRPFFAQVEDEINAFMDELQKEINESANKNKAEV